MRAFAITVAGLLAALITVTSSTSAYATTQATNQTQNTQTVTIQSGDTLSKIAQTHGTTYLRLFYANLQIEDPNLIFAGNQLRIPTADEALAERALPVYQPVAAAPVPAPAPAPAPAAAPAPQAVVPEYEAPAPAPAPQPVAAPAVAGGGVWDQLAQCESGGNWAINTGNGFYGGLQFTLQSWQAVGGSGYPHQASREEQIMRAERLLAMQGWGAWPACTSKLGLR